MLKKIELEDILYLFIILCPVLDICSFLYRNIFNTNFSPSTIIRPIIPIVLFVILFFKEKNKKEKIIFSLIYFVYSIIHLLIFQKLHNQSSYGNFFNEAQYVINYSLMIINLYLFIRLAKNKVKINKAIFVSLTIYIISLFISIITKTSSSTYLEGIGYKGYFESGNSLCTVIVLSLFIIMANTTKKDLTNISLIIFSGIYLSFFSGMRTGLFGFIIVIFVYIVANLFNILKSNIKITKKQISILCVIIICFIIIVTFLGSKTLERRKFLKNSQQNNIDMQTGQVRYVTGDILDIYKKIQNKEIDNTYMSSDEQNSIIRLCDFANRIKLSNVNLRKQQLIYNVFLQLEQKNPILILFGNGYKNQTGELVMEMESLAILINFGVVGFVLYLGPFLYIMVIGLHYGIKNRNKISITYVMYIFGIVLAFALSTFSGYVYFNFSSMTITIVLNILLLKEMGENFNEKNSFWNNKLANWWGRKSIS